MSTEAISLLKLAGFTTTVAVIEYVWISPDMLTLLVMLMILVWLTLVQVHLLIQYLVDITHDFIAK